jgi:hypothetical protein
MQEEMDLIKAVEESNKNAPPNPDSMSYEVINNLT